jgi:Cu(I)/Ag(I) efflux system membrane fusion protein
MAWMKNQADLGMALGKMAGAQDIAGIRSGLDGFSSKLSAAIKSFGIASGQPVYQVHCPMALNGQGADWLQANTDVRNPYYGAAMLSCGNVVGRVDQVSADAAHTAHEPEGSHSEGSRHE